MRVATRRPKTRATGGGKGISIVRCTVFPPSFAENYCKVSTYSADYRPTRGHTMLIEELFGAIREKEDILQRVKAEAQRIEKEIETLRAAVKILDREPRAPLSSEPAAPQTAHAPAPETIRKAFP